MANVSSSNGIEKYPKLRFSEFTEPWSHVKLSDFADRVMRKNKNNETDLPLTISSKDGLVDQISFFNKTVASKDMSGYYLLLNGEYAYNKSYSVGYDFGSIKRLERYPMGALSTLYICFALKKHNSDYIKTYFDSLKWYKEIYMISAEGARNHGLLNVPTDEFFDTYHYITENESEQEKIAKLMKLIEQRIQKQQALVDNLKKYKRGLISSLEDRFSNMVEYHRIGDFYKVQGGFAFKSECFCGAGTPVIRISDINEGKVTVDDAVYYPNDIKIDNRYNLQKGDLLIAMSGATTGKTGVCEFKGNAYLNQRVGKFISTDPSMSIEYLAMIVDSDSFAKSLLNLLVAGAQPNISPMDIESIIVPVFSFPIRKIITDILLGINRSILIQEELLCKSCEMKAGLLQQLFI